MAPAMPIVVPTTTVAANLLLLPTRIASSKKDIKDLYHEYVLCPNKTRRSARRKRFGRPLDWVCSRLDALPNAAQVLPKGFRAPSRAWLDAAQRIFLSGPTFMMRISFEAIPRELDEAAQVDGCSPFTVGLALPCAILFLLLQRHYVRGFMIGALKG
jgi:hypothetical protein